MRIRMVKARYEGEGVWQVRKNRRGVRYLAVLLTLAVMTWAAEPAGREDSYRMHRANGRTYMLFETNVRAGGATAVVLLTGHDVTNVLAARDRALLRFWEMELVVLACAGAVIALLSRWLTRPLARLTQASRSIAAGAYGERTGLAGGDEIGALSRSFDTMAAAIEEKVAALELSVRQREDFMAAFSHELKTPMTAVIGFAETLRSVQCEPEELVDPLLRGGGLRPPAGRAAPRGGLYLQRGAPGGEPLAKVAAAAGPFGCLAHACRAAAGGDLFPRASGACALHRTRCAAKAARTRCADSGRRRSACRSYV